MHIVYPSAEDVAGAMLGRGDVPVYAGSLSQKGYGVGGLLRGLISVIKPIFFAKAKKAIGNAAMGAIQDTVSGVPVTKALKDHALHEGRKVLGDALGGVGKSVLDGTFPTSLASLKQRGQGRSIMKARMNTSTGGNPRKRNNTRNVKSKCKKAKTVIRRSSVFR